VPNLQIHLICDINLAGVVQGVERLVHETTGIVFGGENAELSLTGANRAAHINRRRVEGDSCARRKVADGRTM
jgi:hypothetical protein